MAFLFSHDETFEAEFRRITKEQIAKAHRYLAFCDDGAKSVHGSRKCMKRLRALMRLYRPALGKSDYRQEIERYRDIARLLSSSRDRQVMIETVSELSADVKTLKQNGKSKELLRGLAKVADLLARDSVMGSRGVDDLRAFAVSKRRAIALLDEAQHELGALRLNKSGFAMIRRGFSRSYERGVRALIEARRSMDDDVLHDLRKAVQTHWRQVALFEEAWPDFIAFRVGVAKHLSKILGEHNNLSLVSDFVRTLPSCDCDPKVARAVTKDIKKRQAGLRGTAIEAATMLFADDPKDLSCQMERYWNASRDQQSRRDKNKGRSAQRTSGAAKARATNPFKLPDGL